MSRLQKPRTITPLDKFIGERIRQARIEQGISQMELAKGLGVSFQQLQKYEKGVNRVSSARLVQIATKLNRERAYFFEGPDGGAKMSKEVSRFLTMKDGVKIARDFPKLTPHSRALVVGMVASLARPQKETQP